MGVKLLAWCKKDDANLQRVLDIIADDDNMMEGYEDQMEPIFIEAYGERVTCPTCDTGVFPGLSCWGCEEWTAPEGDTPAKEQ